MGSHVNGERKAAPPSWPDPDGEGRTTPRPGAGTCVHQWFEDRAAREPETIALVYQAQAWTYAELNRQANQLAHHLRRQAVSPEVRVGLCLDRSPELVVGILAILKAGGAYFPLDPTSPPERLAYLLQDAQPQLLLAQRHLEARLSRYAGPVFYLDGDRRYLAHQPDENPASGVTSSNLAYIIYTSGSTGRPKGVLVEHRSLANVVAAQVPAFRIGPDSRVLQFVAAHFDAAQAEIFRALTAGATLCLAPTEDLLSGQALAHFLRARGVTIAALPPTALGALPADAALPALRTLVVAGEACPPALAARWGRGRRLLNAYGPTEATVCATIAADWNPAQPPPLGQPIAHTQVYLLDDRLRPVPAGAVGELYVGGVGVARGYLNRPDLTAACFLPDPFSGRPGARMYRTGDRARRRADGALEFLGRADDQVKVRGHRVELGEVEAVLTDYPGIRQAAVAARADGPGGVRLVAYVVPGDGVALAPADLRRFLKERLPEYMLPSGWVVLRALPRLANGKVDRNALPAPDAKRPDLDRAYAPPTTPVEELVAGVWAEVLQLDPVGVRDDFFELGGNSLLAAQVVSRLRAIYPADLSLRVLFETPTVTGLARRMEDLARQGRGEPVSPLRRADRHGELPLSFAQQRLWFMDQMEPGNPFYNMPAAVRLRGRLDVATLERCLREIGRRHDMLRTTFSAPEGRPVQVIAAAPTGPLARVDLGGVPASERERRAQALAQAEARRPFDLAHGPLFRPSLVRLGDDEHLLLLSMHHIISDAWSLALLTRELAVLYPAFADGRPSPLPELPVQYADYAVWQRQWLQGDILQTRLNYWKRQLANLPAALEFPTDHPRPAVQRFEGGQHAFTLPLPLTERLERFSRRASATLYMTLLAAFQVLLHRYSRQEDIVVGSPVAGRDRPEIEDLIGFFVNMVVLRANLAGDPTFRELLGQVREVCLGALAHADVPFDMLVDELRPERDLSRSPLFQVAFVLQNAPAPTRQFAGIALDPLEVDQGTSRSDISLCLTRTEQGLSGRVIYNTDLFEAPTIARLARHFQALLRGIGVDPDQRVSRLPLLTEGERRQMLVEWNATTTDFPLEKCIHKLVEARVEWAPDAVALTFAGQTMTYGELNRRANRLAHHLRGMGIGSECRVGLCLERSPALVVGVLGILKAGAAYLPLDPAAPAERLAFILRDAQVQALLTQEDLRTGLPALAAPVLCLDSDWPRIAGQPDHNPRGQTTPDHLAYIIYTSGSTGRPKGVLIEHRGLTNVVCAQIRAFDVRPGNRLMQFVSPNFDAAQAEIFRALVGGATLCLASADAILPGPALVQFLRDQAITLIALPPSLLALLPQSDGLPALRTLVVAGESCPPGLAARWSQGRRLLNAYGPTEATVCATIAAGWDAHRAPPLGRPIANTQAYVLDGQLQPVPVGVTGELYLGGVGLARGYLNQPDLTAALFIADPFGTRPGARLYKTGDLARWRPDGELEFVARLDGQVKVRGYRIELGEVEAVLGMHVGVRQAAATTHDDSSGNRRLVAYVVARQEPAPAVSELRRFLKEKLPEYMVPAAWVFLAELPRLANGKVDRNALPPPDSARPEEEKNGAPPRTQTEQVLAGVWAEVLRLERVGIHDNFFELGGDSILSIQVVARANQAGLHLTAKSLFQHQTIAELAAAVVPASAVSAHQGPVTGPVPLTPIQHWFFDQGLPEPQLFNQAVLLEVRQRLEPELLDQAWQRVQAHHDALRLRFVKEASGWRQVNAGPETLEPLARIDLSALAGTEQQAARDKAVTALQESLNLPAGPLARAAVIDRGPDRTSRLLLIIHHLAVDSFSWRIVLEDLLAAYRQLQRGAAVQLPPKTTSFRQWAERLAAHARSEVVREEGAYWLDRSLADVHGLPVDFPAGANTKDSVDTVLATLSTEETRALLQEVPRAFRTQINDVLLAALARAFEDWTGDPRVLIELEMHGREEIFPDVNLSRTVGWFTSFCPVLLDLSETHGPADTLKAVKQQLRAIPNRGLGYGLLRYMSGDGPVAEQLRALPAAEVSFNYLGQMDSLVSESSPWVLDPEGSGLVQSRQGRRQHLLEINAAVLGNQFQVRWAYSTNVHRRTTIEGLAEAFRKALQALIDSGSRADARAYSPTDFPDAGLSQVELDKLLSRIGTAKGGKRA